MRALYLTSVLLHILAAATWIGGMAIFVIAVMPVCRRQPDAVRAEFLEAFGRRFSRVSWICFATLAATGIVNLSMRGVRAGDFLRPEWRSSSFGQVVLLKLSLVVTAVIVMVLHERLAHASHARLLGRSLFGIGAAIVLAAILLVRSI